MTMEKTVTFQKLLLLKSQRMQSSKRAGITVKAKDIWIQEWVRI